MCRSRWKTKKHGFINIYFALSEFFQMVHGTEWMSNGIMIDWLWHDLTNLHAWILFGDALWFCMVWPTRLRAFCFELSYFMGISIADVSKRNSKYWTNTWRVRFTSKLSLFSHRLYRNDIVVILDRSTPNMSVSVNNNGMLLCLGETVIYCSCCYRENQFE